jgi:hypothetical protein
MRYSDCNKLQSDLCGGAAVRYVGAERVAALDIWAGTFLE